jgi:galactokinase
VQEDISKRFGELFDHAPEVIATAPGRVNLIGEHIDYSDGFVLPFAISDSTTVAMARREDRKIRIASLQKSTDIIVIPLDALAPHFGENWARYALGVLWVLQIDTGLDILVDGRVPLGAGLSSSAALECSVATAVNYLFDLKLSLAQLARATQKAENIYVGVPCGIMDQSVSLMAKAGSALLLDCRDLSSENIPFLIAPQGLELLIIDTQAHHKLVDGGYAERRASCEKAVAQLGITSLRDISVADYAARQSELDPITYMRGFHAVTEMKRVLDAVDALKKNNFGRLGELLNQSHRSLRDDYEVSCPELNLAVNTAVAQGALGARMVGGGFGGSAIALINTDQVKKCEQAISRAFSGASFKPPRFFTSLPSEGARVIAS